MQEMVMMDALLNWNLRYLAKCAATGLLITLTAVGSPSFADNTQRKPLEGRVQVEDSLEEPSPFAGTWKLHIKEFRRHPSIHIDRQDGSNITGTYHGLLGRFPMNGTIDVAANKFTMHVDFSRSIIARRRKMDSAVAVFTGSIDRDGGLITGTACIPELGPRCVAFSAKKAESL